MEVGGERIVKEWKMEFSYDFIYFGAIDAESLEKKKQYKK